MSVESQKEELRGHLFDRGFEVFKEFRRKEMAPPLGELVNGRSYRHTIRCVALRGSPEIVGAEASACCLVRWGRLSAWRFAVLERNARSQTHFLDAQGGLTSGETAVQR